MWPSTPITQTRAAMVQDLYQMAFFRQLADEESTRSNAPSQLTDESLSDLLREYSAFLARIDHVDDAELLLNLADEAAPRVPARSA